MVLIQRKIYNKILDWKEKSKGSTALLIDGARRVGKSYIVEEFAKNNYKSYILLDFNKVPDDIKNLFNIYLDDLDSLFLYLSNYYNVTLYERNSLIIFDEVQLYPKAKNTKKFKIISLNKKTKFRDYEDAMFWLTDAMIINQCFNATEPSIGLKLNSDNTFLKCYMADTGLLISHSFDENGLVSEEIYKKILFDKLEFNGGMIIENIVSQMLVASGHKLYFYSNNSRNKEDRMKIDFLISKNSITSKHNICPIEVKSGKNYTLTSLNKFRKKYKDKLSDAYVIHTGDYRQIDGIIYLPLYMTPLL